MPLNLRQSLHQILNARQAVSKLLRVVRRRLLAAQLVKQTVRSNLTVAEVAQLAQNVVQLRHKVDRGRRTPDGSRSRSRSRS